MEHQGFKRNLSLLDSFTLAAGTTIASGICIVSAGIARDVRSSALLMLVWMVASLMSLTGALTVAEMAAMMPMVGGYYVLLRESYGRLVGFSGSRRTFVRHFASVWRRDDRCLVLVRGRGKLDRL
jgi:APA family basic amino acid/polyamine antiporter